MPTPDINVSLNAWYVFAGMVTLGLVVVIFGRRMRAIFRAMLRLSLMVFFAASWITLAYVIIYVPFMDLDLSIDFFAVTIPSKLVKVLWIAFAVLLLAYWLTQIIKLFRQRKNPPQPPV